MGQGPERGQWHGVPKNRVRFRRLSRRAQGKGPGARVLRGLVRSVKNSRKLNNRFAIPDCKYYLGDARYTLNNKYLTTYSGVRYHLCESYQLRGE